MVVFETLGPLVRTLQLMALDVMNFLFVFLSIFIGFAAGRTTSLTHLHRNTPH
jgi:hypothetical protein